MALPGPKTVPSRFRFCYLPEWPNIRHKPRHEQTDQASEHNLGNSFEADFNPTQLRVMCEDGRNNDGRGNGCRRHIAGMRIT